MLRRVARVLRILLLGSGLATLLLGAVTLFVGCFGVCPLPRGFIQFFVVPGVVDLWWLDDNPDYWSKRFVLNVEHDAEGPPIHEAVLPKLRSTTLFNGADTLNVRIPLWLLAFLCLAWPVTSFIIARKRKGRGFEVEPAGTSNIQHPTSNIEAP